MGRGRIFWHSARALAACAFDMSLIGRRRGGPLARKLPRTFLPKSEPLGFPNSDLDPLLRLTSPLAGVAALKYPERASVLLCAVH